MSQKIDSIDQDIINELTDMEYDEDDALTLLDDEEMQATSQDTEDEDLTSFYLDYPEETMDLTDKVDLYTEEPIEEIEEAEDEFQLEDNVVEEIEEIPQHTQLEDLKDENIQDGYSGQIDKFNNNIDAYLSGALEIKPREEIKVEKMESVVVPAVKPIEPIFIKPIEVKVEPQVQDTKVNNADLSNLNQLFAKVEDNVKGASDIVNRNAEIKRKIDERYEELQRIQVEHEKNKQSDYNEINAYKDDVYSKLKTRKLEIEEELTSLKRDKEIYIKEKTTFDQERELFRIEKEAFEKERLESLANISQKEKELHDTYNERVKNIEQVEDGLIRRKEQLDIEKSAILKDREDVEVEKKELAENLVKFNQLVDNFTKGVDRFNETN